MMAVSLIQFLGCIENRTVKSAFACNVFNLFEVTNTLRQAAETSHDIHACECSRTHLLLLYLQSLLCVKNKILK